MADYDHATDAIRAIIPAIREVGKKIAATQATKTDAQAMMLNVCSRMGYASFFL